MDGFLICFEGGGCPYFCLFVYLFFVSLPLNIHETRLIASVFLAGVHGLPRRKMIFFLHERGAEKAQEKVREKS